MNTRQKVKGFTIIEVVLVLAIAGLIFLMVFVALPALQAGQRDTARKNDASMVASAYTSFINNNRGKEPSTTQLREALEVKMSGDEVTGFGQLSGNTTNLSVSTRPDGQVTVPEGVIRVYKKAKCGTVSSAGKVTTSAGTARQIAVVARLEGSNGTGYCLDS